MKKIDKDKFILSTGRELSFCKGIIGINEQLEDIYEGYDGSIELKSFDFDKKVIEKINYTPKEITEICDYAIDLWQKMKEKYTGVTQYKDEFCEVMMPYLQKLIRDIVNIETSGLSGYPRRVSFPKITKITISKKGITREYIDEI